MRYYETTFIVNPQTDDATLNRHVSDVADVIMKNNGTIVFEERMGTRRLAYPIQGLTQGYYASFIYESSIDVLPVLERHFRMNEAYIRFLTVRFEGDPEKLAAAKEESGQETESVNPPVQHAEASDEKSVSHSGSDEISKPKASEETSGGEEDSEPAADDEQQL